MFDLFEHVVDGNGDMVDVVVGVGDLCALLKIAGGDAVPEPLRRYAGAQWLRPSVAQYVAHARVPFVRYF